MHASQNGLTSLLRHCSAQIDCRMKEGTDQLGMLEECYDASNINHKNHVIVQTVSELTSHLLNF
jgi:hypothetical protein